MQQTTYFECPRCLNNSLFYGNNLAAGGDMLRIVSLLLICIGRDFGVTLAQMQN